MIDHQGTIDPSRFELSWGRSATRWVAITDRHTGVTGIGRDHTSWEAALAKAVASLRARTRTPSR